MGVCAIVSFRLGLTDGVSVVAALWDHAIRDLGWSTYTVAGDGPVDRVVPGLAIDAAQPPTSAELTDALADADLVLVENMLSIPMNLPASRVLIDVLRDRPALLHHHDPPWQRERYAHITELPPDDRRWRHVTINRMTEQQFADRGLQATTIYNGFDTNPPVGDRAGTRDWLGIGADEIMVAHPVRAIARKNIPAAIALAESLGATYWLPGQAEEGYENELEAVLQRARCPVLRNRLAKPLAPYGTGQDKPQQDEPWQGEPQHDEPQRHEPEHSISDLYAACDLVAFPSTWEGFGNPPIEAALHRRLAAVGAYPVADELRQLGFQWFDPDDTDTIASAIALTPDHLLDHNQQLAKQHLSVENMTNEVERLFEQAGWKP